MMPLSMRMRMRMAGGFIYPPRHESKSLSSTQLGNNPLMTNCKLALSQLVNITSYLTHTECTSRLSKARHMEGCMIGKAGDIITQGRTQRYFLSRLPDLLCKTALHFGLWPEARFTHAPKRIAEVGRKSDGFERVALKPPPPSLARQTIHEFNTLSTSQLCNINASCRQTVCI